MEKKYSGRTVLIIVSEYEEKILKSKIKDVVIDIQDIISILYINTLNNMAAVNMFKNVCAINYINSLYKYHEVDTFKIINI